MGRPSTSEPPENPSERSTPPGAEEEYLIIALDEEEEEVAPVESNSGQAWPLPVHVCRCVCVSECACLSPRHALSCAECGETGR